MSSTAKALAPKQRRVLWNISNNTHNHQATSTKRKQCFTRNPSTQSVAQPPSKKQRTLTLQPRKSNETYKDPFPVSRQHLQRLPSARSTSNKPTNLKTIPFRVDVPSKQTKQIAVGDFQEQPDYVQDMYKSFRTKETVIQPYLHKQPEIDGTGRLQLVEWLLRYTSHLTPETYFLAVDILDRFLSRRRIRASSMVITGVAAFLIAIKYEEVRYLRVKSILKKLGLKDTIAPQELLQRETLILQTLHHKLTRPSAYSFLARYTSTTDDATKERALSILTKTLLSYDLRLMYKPSQLAAASVYLAGAWTLNLVVTTQYPTAEVKRIAQAVIAETRTISSPPKKTAAKENA